MIAAKLQARKASTINGNRSRKTRTHCGRNTASAQESSPCVQAGKGRNKNWVVTVSLESGGDYYHTDNSGRMEAAKAALKAAVAKTKGNGVILFPGGWFNAGKDEARTLYPWIEKELSKVLQSIRRHIVICVGIDGRVGQYQVDQIAMAIDRDGIMAIGRKFHAAKFEKGHIELARDYQVTEDGRQRLFDLDGQKYFMSVCYDGFGIRQKNLANPGASAVLDLVHWFYPPGKGPSGEKYFARHGFAGASKQWNCPAFGAAVFYHRVVPTTWPTGVFWNQGNKSTKFWKYQNNPMRHESLIQKAPEGNLHLGIFSAKQRIKSFSAQRVDSQLCLPR